MEIIFKLASTIAANRCLLGQDKEPQTVTVSKIKTFLDKFISDMTQLIAILSIFVFGSSSDHM